MPVCPYTLLKPLFHASDAVLQRVNAANLSLRPYSNVLFGLFSLSFVLQLQSPAYEFGGPDKPVDTAKVGMLQDGSLQFNWFQWKPFITNLNISAFYFLRTYYGVDWWTDLWALVYLSLEGVDTIISTCLGNCSRKMTILGGVSSKPFQLIPKDGNAYDRQRLRLTEWKYALGLVVRRIALTSLAGRSFWSLYRQYFMKQQH